MKRIAFLAMFVCFLVSLILPAAMADDTSPDLFRLWDIPFGFSASDVATKLRLDHGMTFTRTTYAPSKLTPQHESIDSANDEDLSLYGFPYHFFYDDYYGAFVLSFSFTYDQADAINTVVSGLFSKYGAPDCLSLLLSDHSLMTDIPASAPVHSVADALAMWDLQRLPDGSSLFFRINNINCSIISSETLVLTIEFNPQITPIRGESYDTF